MSVARRAKPSAGQPRTARESILDLDHAIAELTTARDEIAYVDATTTDSMRHRDARLVEPVARLGLVRRYLDVVLARYTRFTQSGGRGA